MLTYAEAVASQELWIRREEDKDRNDDRYSVYSFYKNISTNNDVERGGARCGRLEGSFGLHGAADVRD